MTASAKQLFGPGEGGAAGESPRLPGNPKWLIIDATTQALALAALASAAPATSGTLIRRNWWVEPLNMANTWLGEVEYGLARRGVSPATGALEFEFDTTRGGTTHLNYALAHMGDYALPGETPVVHPGAPIWVVRGPNGLEAQGVDVTPPADALAFSIQAFQASVNLSTIYAATRHVNSASVAVSAAGVTGTFAASELLFLGAAGSWRAARSDWAIRYSYLASPTRTNFAIGAITGITKRGFDYLWCAYAEELNFTTFDLYLNLVGVHVERIWPEAALGGLPGLT